MNKKQEIQQALTAAMKGRDEDTKRTLRLVMSAIKLAEVEANGELDDNRVLGILQKEVKTREDIITESKQANRDDLAEAAEKEMAILNQFLPQQMDPAELKALAQGVITELGASSMREMGEVMKQLMPKLEGRASGSDASKAVREILQNQ
ncbi:MAG: GatB/YqeY domain-containing protein [Anaerolineaceae bacterium]|nr:GatB/YqeY domain-containing protein [Anaerolineaceae bacterium]